MRTLVTGVSGYVGASLAPALAREGHSVRGFARSPGRVTVALDDLVTGDVLTGAGLDEPFEVAFDPTTVLGGFARVDETNPATGRAWAPEEIDATEFGVRHAPNARNLRVAQTILEVVYDRNPPTPIPPAAS